MALERTAAIRAKWRIGAGAVVAATSTPFTSDVLREKAADLRQ
jgi:hypothetical protein